MRTSTGPRRWVVGPALGLVAISGKLMPGLFNSRFKREGWKPVDKRGDLQ